MSTRNSGYIVETKKGERGRTRHRDAPINGKTIVYLEDGNFKPILDEKGNQKKLLCNQWELKMIGYSD